MELECKTTHLNCYDTVLDTTLYQEETLESIVPDACPDILRIVDTEAVVCLKSKEAQEGRIGSRWPEPPGAPSSTSPMAPKGSGG